MERVKSADGTVIAFDQVGSGPPLVLVAGASCDRAVDRPLADSLAAEFTVLNYDRRGRGDSSDTLPYAVDRELEDIDALLDAAGGSASVLGLSSGAVLAADAAAAGLAVEHLIMWEPPFSVDEDGRQHARKYVTELGRLLHADHRDDALALFMNRVGMPEEMIAGARQSPFWQPGVAMAHTLAYDAAIMGDGSPDHHNLSEVSSPTLVLTGSRSPQFLCQAATLAARAIPGATLNVLDGQDHNVAGDAITPVLSDFVRK